MKNEEYAGMLGLAECGGDDGDNGMSCSDVQLFGFLFIEIYMWDSREREADGYGTLGETD